MSIIEKKIKRRNLLRIKRKQQLTRIIDLSEVALPRGNNLSNFSIKNCYAKHLHECTEKISKEHYMSKSILVKIGKISSEGLPWMKGKKIDLEPQSLTTKCLCNGHNNQLSHLDDLAGKIFDGMSLFATPQKIKLRIAGKYFERWCLKVLLGLMASNTQIFKGRKVTENEIPQDWVDILFERKSFVESMGLYTIYKEGDKVYPRNEVKTELLFTNNQVSGLQIAIRGIIFILAMHDPRVMFGSEYSKIIYHIKKMTRADNMSTIEIIW